MWDFTADQTSIWTIALAEYVFIIRVMFIVNSKEGVCSTYHVGCKTMDSLFLVSIYLYSTTTRYITSHVSNPSLWSKVLYKHRNESPVC